MNYTQILADYLSDLRYEDIPKEVIERAKLLTMHVVGAAMAAKPTKMGKNVTTLVKAQMDGGEETATIIGDGTKVSMMGAAFANGTLSDILDWEDCSWTGHPSAGAVPSGLAFAEGRKKSGKEYLTALVGGYDVYQRIAMAVNTSIDMCEKRWGLTSWQIFAAAMPVAKMMNFDKDTMNKAIGMAATLTPIAISVTHDSRSDAYHYHHGFVARDGIAGNLVVEKGIATLRDALTEGDGYAATVSDQEDLSWYDRDLGKQYLIMETLFKHWPANMWIQVPIELLDKIVRAHNVKADEIKQIRVSPFVAERMNFHEDGFESLVEAQFSIPYCMAMYLMYEPGAIWAEENNLRSKEMLEIASKVYADPKEEYLTSDGFYLFQAGSFPEYTVTVEMNDGATYTESMRYSKGHPKNAMTWDECEEVFRRSSSACLTSEEQDLAIAFFKDLENVDDMSKISQYLKGSK